MRKASITTHLLRESGVFQALSGCQSMASSPIYRWHGTCIRELSWPPISRLSVVLKTKSYNTKIIGNVILFLMRCIKILIWPIVLLVLVKTVNCCTRYFEINSLHFLPKPSRYLHCNFLKIGQRLMRWLHYVQINTQMKCLKLKQVLTPLGRLYIPKPYSF